MTLDAEEGWEEERTRIKEERKKAGRLVRMLGKFLSISCCEEKKGPPEEFTESPQCSPVKSHWDFSPRKQHRTSENTS